MKRFKAPTHTSLVLEALKNADDFMSYDMLIAAGCGNKNQVAAACSHLRSRNAVWVEIDPTGKAWWAASPETDNRSYKHDERTPEVKPRKPRRRKEKA